MNDDDFLAAFEGATLPPDAFHHRDHLRLAWKSSSFIRGLSGVGGHGRGRPGWSNTLLRYQDNVKPGQSRAAPVVPYGVPGGRGPIWSSMR